MANKKITAVSAIGNPASFEKTLEDISAQVAYSIRFPDHHEYTMAEMQKSIMDQAVEHIIPRPLLLQIKMRLKFRQNLSILKELYRYMY